MRIIGIKNTKFSDIISIWTLKYREIFKFALVYLQESFFPQNTSIGCFRRKQPLGAVLGKKGVLRCHFLSEVEMFRMFCWRRSDTGKIMNLFLAPEHLDSSQKEPVLVSAKLTWKKNTVQRLLLYIIIMVAYPDLERIWITINFCTSLISSLISTCKILRMKPRTQSGNA